MHCYNPNACIWINRCAVIAGNAGLGMSLLIVSLSFMVALLTALSLSAIATCGTSHKLGGVIVE